MFLYKACNSEIRSLLHERKALKANHAINYTEMLKLIKKINKKIDRKIAKLSNEILGSKTANGPNSKQDF